MTKVQPEPTKVNQCCKSREERPALTLAPAQMKGGDDVLLTPYRDCVPELLEKQGVTLELWRQTYDVVAKFNQEDAKIQGTLHKMNKPQYIPLAPFLYPHLMSRQAKLARGWHNLIPTLQTKYGPLGIHVTLARGPLAKSGKIDPIVGLSFEVWKPAVVEEAPQDRNSEVWRQPVEHKRWTPLPERMIQSLLPFSVAEPVFESARRHSIE